MRVELPGAVLHCGDCLEVMPTLDPVDAIVCDPPYGLGFMGKDWDHGVPGVHFWTEALRVAKPGAHLLASGGTRTFHRLACAIEDAGWEIRDCVMWVYGSGFPKSFNLDGEWKGWGTALKPAWEPVIVARKPVDGTVAENVQRYGTGAINVDGCRVGTTVETWPKSRSYPFGNGRTYGGGPGAIPTPSAPIGRWPANLIHDGSDEAVGLFPETTSGKLSPHHRLKASDNLAMSGPNQKRSPRNEFGGDSGSAARFFYCAKASKADRDEGLDCESRPPGGMSGRHDGSMGSITMRRNHHPTVKPTALMRYLCRLVTPPGGVVLDPFMGSGSTGKAAIAEGFRFVGIELEKEYFNIACARVGAAKGDGQLVLDAK